MFIYGWKIMNHIKPFGSAVGFLKNEEKSHHMCKSCCWPVEMRFKIVPHSQICAWPPYLQVFPDSFPHTPSFPQRLVFLGRRLLISGSMPINSSFWAMNIHQSHLDVHQGTGVWTYSHLIPRYGAFLANALFAIAVPVIVASSNISESRGK